MTDKILIDRAVLEQALKDICGAKLCEINSMSSRHEMLRLMEKSASALRAALVQHQRNHSCDNELQRETRHLSTTSSSVPTGWKLVPVELTQSMIDQLRFGWSDISTAHVIDRWKRTISAAPQPTVVEQEPVAWAIFVDSGNARMWTTFQPHIQKLADAEGLAVTPLYTHPQPRHPLTDEQIAEVLIDATNGRSTGIGFKTLRALARAIERAHGIGSEK